MGLIAKLACDHIKRSECNMKEDQKGNEYVSVNLLIFSSICWFRHGPVTSTGFAVLFYANCSSVTELAKHVVLCLIRICY